LKKRKEGPDGPWVTINPAERTIPTTVQLNDTEQ
jgi:hypothetical protein